MPDNTLAKFEPDMEAIPSADLNALGRAADAFLGSDFGPGFREGNGRFTAFPRGGSGGIGSPSRRFKITTLHANYVEAQEWNGTTTGATVNIAKHPSIRNTITSYTTPADTFTCTYDTNATTRTATGTVTGIVETHKLNVPYVVEDEIWAVKPTGGTGVTDCDWIAMHTPFWVRMQT